MNYFICSSCLWLIFFNLITFYCSLKWWSLEVLTLLSGLLPNPTLEASVLSIWYQFILVNLWEFRYKNASDTSFVYAQLNNFHFTLHYTIWLWSCCKVWFNQWKLHFHLCVLSYVHFFFLKYSCFEWIGSWES